MRSSRKTVVAAVVAVLGCSALPAVWADELVVSGEVLATVRGDSVIVVQPPDRDEDPVMILGFPFANLEAQLNQVLEPRDPDAEGVVIEMGDCISLVYFEKERPRGGVVNKFVVLTFYSEGCGDCAEQPCYDDPYGMTRQPQRVRR